MSNPIFVTVEDRAGLDSLESGTILRDADGDVCVKGIHPIMGEGFYYLPEYVTKGEGDQAPFFPTPSASLFVPFVVLNHAALGFGPTANREEIPVSDLSALSIEEYIAKADALADQILEEQGPNGDYSPVYALSLERHPDSVLTVPVQAVLNVNVDGFADAGTTVDVLWVRGVQAILGNADGLLLGVYPNEVTLILSDDEATAEAQQAEVTRCTLLGFADFADEDDAA